MSLIYTRSPFFIQSTSGSTANVSLYVWNGNSSSVPSSAQYSLSKSHNSDGKATFEVSELIRDYVDQSFNGDYVTEAVWVYISMVDGAGTGVSDKYLATDGYIDEDFVQYWSKSDNNLKSDEVLMSNDYISVPEDTTAVIPTKDADTAVFYRDGEVKFISELANKNLIQGSEDFSHWSKLGTSFTVTENEDVNPFGNSGSYTINVTNNDNILYKSIGGLSSNKSGWNFSLYAKGSGSFDMNVRLNSSQTTTETKLLSDEWTRFDVSVSIDTTVTSAEGYVELNTSSSYKVFGAQVESSASPTNYSSNDSNSSGAINYATSAGQSASTFYARVMKDGGTIIDENCSDDIMEYVSELDIDEAHVIKSDGKVEVISVETLPCNKYENVRLTFVNKFGALQDIHFSAKTTESMSAKGSSYNSINFDYDNLSNNYGSHSVRDFNKNATVRHTLNTDYLHESYSEVFRQLIVSEEVWMEHKGSVRPVNVTTNSLQKKTHANNGLVQFTVSVKESHSLINNIR